eukprot:gene11568-24188_t
MTLSVFDPIYEVLRKEIPLWKFVGAACTAGFVRWIIIRLSNKTSIKSTDVNVSKTKVTEPQIGLEDDYDDEYENIGELKNNYNITDGPFKMMLCVNMELKMDKGKIAAQCGHATLGAYKIGKKYCNTATAIWERLGQAKVAVKVDNLDDMIELEEKASAKGLITYIVEDAGRTQIAAGSQTVLAIGPAPIKKLWLTSFGLQKGIRGSIHILLADHSLKLEALVQSTWAQKSQKVLVRWTSVTIVELAVINSQQLLPTRYETRDERPI